MIEFVTLLMGLVIGPQVVETAVDARAATVELRLDGRQVAYLEDAPWRAEVDFGAVLEPRRLEAVAYDAAGGRLAETFQLVNYAGSNYRLAIALDPAASPGERSGRLVWRAVLEQAPRRIRLLLDGRHVEVSEGGRFALPPHQPERLHHLEAQVEFQDGAEARAELTFGGAFGGQVSTTLTAVPVRERPATPWQAAEIAGALLRDGRPLGVFTVRGGEGRLIVVRDHGFRRLIGRVRRHLAKGPKGSPQAVHRPDAGIGFGVSGLDTRPLKEYPGTYKLVDLDAVAAEHGLTPVLLIQESLVGDGVKQLQRRQRLGESVAVAGAVAAGTNGRRAVLLLLGDEPKDQSSLSFEQTVHYLASVRVPLFIWAPGEQVLARELKELGGSAALAAVEDRIYYGVGMFRQMLGDLERELGAQTIVWVEGEHLPTEISLSQTAPPGLTLIR